MSNAQTLAKVVSSTGLLADGVLSSTEISNALGFVPGDVTLTDTQTLTNKTVELGSNTLSGTTAQFNAALTDDNFATQAGTETLTNKTIDYSNNTLSGVQPTLVSGTSLKTVNGTSLLGGGDITTGDVTLTGTQTLTNKTISGASNTLSNIGNSSLTNSSVTVNGSIVSLGGSTTVTAVNPNALTIGTGLSGTSYNGSGAVTIAIDSTVATLTGTQTLTNKTLTRAMLKDTGWDYYDSNTTNALDYTNGSHQRWAPTASSNPTLSITNWPPTGNLGELLIEGVNLGAATITWPTINWIKSDGTTTTAFNSNGVTLQSSGIDWVFLWTRDSGTTIYGKVVR